MVRDGIPIRWYLSRGPEASEDIYHLTGEENTHRTAGANSLKSRSVRECSRSTRILLEKRKKVKSGRTQIRKVGQTHRASQALARALTFSERDRKSLECSE